MTQALVLDGDGPLHAQIRRAVSRPILAGDWAPGDRIPSEHDLMALFGASRMTVNRAMRSLATSGMIVRRRRTGSSVADLDNACATIALPSLRRLVEARGGKWRCETIARRRSRASADIAARFAVAPGTPILNICCRHYAGEDAVGLEDYWLNLGIFAEAPAELAGDGYPDDWLRACQPFAPQHCAVTAASAGSAISRHLGIDAGAACLKIERTTWRGDQTASYVAAFLPGDAFKLTGDPAPS